MGDTPERSGQSSRERAAHTSRQTDQDKHAPSLCACVYTVRIVSVRRFCSRQLCLGRRREASSKTSPGSPLPHSTHAHTILMDEGVCGYHGLISSTAETQPTIFEQRYVTLKDAGARGLVGDWQSKEALTMLSNRQAPITSNRANSKKVTTKKGGGREEGRTTLRCVCVCRCLPFRE